MRGAFAGTTPSTSHAKRAARYAESLTSSCPQRPTLDNNPKLTTTDVAAIT